MVMIMSLYARILREIDHLIKEDMSDQDKLRCIKAQLSLVELPQDMDEEEFDAFMKRQEAFSRHHTLFFTELPFSFKEE